MGQEKGVKKNKVVENQILLEKNLELKNYLEKYEVVAIYEVSKNIFEKHQRTSSEIEKWVKGMGPAYERHKKGLDSMLKKGILYKKGKGESYTISGIFWVLGNYYEEHEKWLAAGHCYGAVADCFPERAWNKWQWDLRSAFNYSKLLDSGKVKGEDNIKAVKKLISHRFEFVLEAKRKLEEYMFGNPRLDLAIVSEWVGDYVMSAQYYEELGDLSLEKKKCLSLPTEICRAVVKAVRCYSTAVERLSRDLKKAEGEGIRKVNLRILGEIKKAIEWLDVSEKDVRSGLVEYLTTCVEASELMKHYFASAQYYEKLGDISLDVNEWDEAIKYYEHATEMLKKALEARWKEGKEIKEKIHAVDSRIVEGFKRAIEDKNLLKKGFVLEKALVFGAFSKSIDNHTAAAYYYTLSGKILIGMGKSKKGIDDYATAIKILNKVLKRVGDEKSKLRSVLVEIFCAKARLRDEFLKIGDMNNFEVMHYSCLKIIEYYLKELESFPVLPEGELSGMKKANNRFFEWFVKGKFERRDGVDWARTAAQYGIYSKFARLLIIPAAERKVFGKERLKKEALNSIVNSYKATCLALMSGKSIPMPFSNELGLEKEKIEKHLFAASCLMNVAKARSNIGSATGVISPEMNKAFVLILLEAREKHDVDEEIVKELTNDVEKLKVGDTETFSLFKEWKKDHIVVQLKKRMGELEEVIEKTK